MRYFVLVFTLVLTLVLASVASAQSKEETVVRQTYAKLAFAVNVGSIHEALRDPNVTRDSMNARIEKDQLQFHLSGFTTGRIIDIGQRKWSEFATKPYGEDVVSMSIGNTTYTQADGTKEMDETVKVLGWKSGSQIIENWGNFTVSQVVADSQKVMKAQYVRYAAYKVTVTYAGRSRTVNGVFLFPTTGDVLAIDSATGNSVLSSIAKSTIYPKALLRTDLRGKPGVADFLRSHQSFASDCTPGREDVCCDPSTLQCGVPSAEVESSLSKPVSQNATMDQTLDAIAEDAALPAEATKPNCVQFNATLGPSR